MFKKIFSIIDFYHPLSYLQWVLIWFRKYFRISKFKPLLFYSLKEILEFWIKIISTKEKHCNKKHFYKKLKQNISNKKLPILKYNIDLEENELNLLHAKSTIEYDFFELFETFKIIKIEYFMNQNLK